MGFLDSLTGSNIGDATLKAIGSNRGLLSDFRLEGSNVIDSGEQKARDALYGGVDNFNTWLSDGKVASGTYLDALGINGADGTSRAQSAFQAGPGYDFAMDQGTKAALRGASAAGMLNSGNTLTALTQYGQGLANQEYGSWLDRLKGVSDTGLSAAGGMMSGISGVANAAQAGTDNRLALLSGVTQGRMGFNNDEAQVMEQKAANKGGFLGGLLKTGLSLGGKALTGGLF